MKAPTIIATNPVAIKTKTLPTSFMLTKPQFYKSIVNIISMARLMTITDSSKIMNCKNVKIGCYHDNAIHFEGKGKCLVRGCKCEKFQ